jgi:hypothetical protein
MRVYAPHNQAAEIGREAMSKRKIAETELEREMAADRAAHLEEARVVAGIGLDRRPFEPQEVIEINTRPEDKHGRGGRQSFNRASGRVASSTPRALQPLLAPLPLRTHVSPLALVLAEVPLSITQASRLQPRPSMSATG